MLCVMADGRQCVLAGGERGGDGGGQGETDTAELQPLQTLGRENHTRHRHQAHASCGASPVLGVAWQVTELLYG